MPIGRINELRDETRAKSHKQKSYMYVITNKGLSCGYQFADLLESSA